MSAIRPKPNIRVTRCKVAVVCGPSEALEQELIRSGIRGRQIEGQARSHVEPERAVWVHMTPEARATASPRKVCARLLSFRRPAPRNPTVRGPRASCDEHDEPAMRATPIYHCSTRSSQPHPGARRQRVHRSSSITCRSVSGLTSPRKRTRAPPAVRQATQLAGLTAFRAELPELTGLRAASRRSISASASPPAMRWLAASARSRRATTP